MPSKPGPGETLRLDRGGIEEGTRAAWLPDGKRLVFIGREPGHKDRGYVRTIDGSGRPQPFTPENVSTRGDYGLLPISPDGHSVVMRDPTGTPTIYPIDGGEPRPLPGMEQGDHPVRWADDRTLFISRYRQNKLHVYRLDVTTGRKESFREIP